MALRGREVVITRNTKLRHLKLKPFSQVVQVLSVCNRWLEIAGKIKRYGSETEFLYSATDISTLESQVKKGRCPAEAFLDNWSITGVQQPTVGDLLDLLIDAQLFQAADTLSQQLGVSATSESDTVTLVTKLPTEVNGDSVENSDSQILAEKSTAIIGSSILHVQTNGSCTVPNESLLPNPGHHSSIPNIICSLPPKLEDIPAVLSGNEFVQLDCFTSLQQAIMRSTTLNYRYEYLANITGNFCDIPVYQGGYKLGEGAFGIVYRAYANGQWVAIKRLKDAVDRQFVNELEVLSQYKHENLLPLLGYSDDGPYCCLIYQFMMNGSLQERLACSHDTMPISWKTRIVIACGTARGINHLHTFRREPLVHRDIKSANILLDENLVPKVGDFGLARVGSTGTASTVQHTSNVIGTSVYMAREAFNGDVSVKLDTFSFGVVLLELLTGLPPYDASREETDLISFMEENCDTPEDILKLLDVKAGDWEGECAITLYELSKRCLEVRKRDRPTLAQVLPDLEVLLKKCCILQKNIKLS